MGIRHLFLVIMIASGVAAGCQSPRTEPEAGKGINILADKNTLTAKERFYCDSLKIDTSIVIELRKETDAALEPFHYSLSKMFTEGKEIEMDPIYLQGFVFEVDNTRSSELVMGSYKKFREKGYSLFVLENHFNINAQKDDIGLLKTADKYEVLKQIKTDGANWSIDTDSVISIIKRFDKQCSLDLVGASGDWCEFVINKPPSDWLAFAKEVYKICPDVVEQGAETVEALAAEMKRTKILYLWWD